MQNALSSLVDNLSMINKEPKNKIIVSGIDNKILINKFFNTCQLCNKDLNKFTLLLRKGVYPYEYMDSWKRFDEESLLDKESHYSELNKEHIADENHAHGQKVWDTFSIKT